MDAYIIKHVDHPDRILVTTTGAHVGLAQGEVDHLTTHGVVVVEIGEDWRYERAVAACSVAAVRVI